MYLNFIDSCVINTINAINFDNFSLSILIILVIVNNNTIIILLSVTNITNNPIDIINLIIIVPHSIILHQIFSRALICISLSQTCRLITYHHLLNNWRDLTLGSLDIRHL